MTPFDFHILKYAGDKFLYHVPSMSLMRTSSEVSREIISREFASDPFNILINRNITNSHSLQTCSCIPCKSEANVSAKDKRSQNISETLSKLVLLVSQGCNMRCTYCFLAEQNRSSLYMSSETACKAVQVFLQQYQDRLSTILFFGGEPLLNWKTIQTVVSYTLKYCSAHHIQPPTFAIQTNGTLIDSTKATYLKEHNFSVTISLDGAPLINDKQRILLNGKGTSRKILEGISNVRKNNIRFNIEATITMLHYELGISVQDVFSYLVNLGAYSVHIMPVAGQLTNLTLQEHAIKKLANQFGAIAMNSVSSLVDNNPKRLQYTLYIIENLLMGSHRHICYAGIGTATVDVHGNIYPCYYLSSDDFFMGSIHDKDWAMRFAEVQNSLNNHTKEHIWPCSECWAKHLCNSCYGAMPGSVRKLSAPAREVCLIQREVIDATLSKLIEIYNLPENWNKLLENLVSLIG